MARWRLIILGALVSAPIAVLVAAGLYYFWEMGWSVWTWWPLSACFALAYFLGWRWQKKQHLLKVDFVPEVHWTDRDRAAWQLVEERAKQAASLKADRLLSFPLYVETAEAMALELAQFYHPRAKDPIGSLTLPEILAVIELAARDLGEMVDEYLPGGHLLSVNDLRRLKQVADWYPLARNISWAVSALFSPFNTAVRYLASEAGMSRPWQMLQENVILWFYTAYVHRLGNYLIDVNSGRLRVGAQRYLELKKAHTAAAPGQTEETDPADEVPTVTFALVGQTKAGKSSLINSLLGEQQAFTDVLPATAGVQRYTLQPPGIPTRFQLLDTEGYGNKGPDEGQLKATVEAARQADVVLLVLHARNPARQGDLDLLTRLRAFFEKHQDLRQPSIVAVVTHVDLLSPSLEWAPPYNWREPTRPKERQIGQAVEAVRESLGEYLAAVVPVCTSPGKVSGIQEELLPAIVGLLDQAHAVAFLRCLKAEIDTGKVRRVFTQMLAAGKGILQVFGHEFGKAFAAKK